MKVQYIHCSSPYTVKIHDTVKAFHNTRCWPGSPQTQKEYDAFELKKFRADKRKGIILSFEVLTPIWAENEECYVCPRCDYQLEDGQHYCDNCGYELEWEGYGVNL
jgi:hypothetical protein